VAGTLGCSQSPTPGDATTTDAVPSFPNRRPKFEPNGRFFGYVANRQSDSVSVLDLDAMTELGQVPVGRDPVDIDGPRHVLLDAAQSAMFVALSYPLVADSPHALASSGGPRLGYVVELALDDLRPLGEARVAANPSELALADDGSALAVAHYDTVLALQSAPDIDSRRATVGFATELAGFADGSVRTELVPVCVAPAAVVYGADSTRAFVACTGEDSLASVDISTRTVTARVAAGPASANKPYALTRNANGTLLALSNQVAQAIGLFSAEAAPVPVGNVSVPGVPFFADFLADSTLLVPLQGPSGVARVDVTTLAVTRAITFADDACENPSDVEQARDGRLFVVCEGDHYTPGAVVELDPTTLEITARVEVGVYPDRLAVRAP
jgi:YVTN family beta-propeller protein